MNWVSCMVCLVGRLCHPHGSAVLVPSAWWDVLGSEFSGPLLGSSGFVVPSLGHEEEENGVRHFQSLSVEGVTQLQRFNTQLPHFRWALNFLPFLPRQLWGLGSMVVRASAVITHPLKCLLLLPSLPVQQSSSLWEILSETHTTGGSRAPWLL